MLSTDFFNCVQIEYGLCVQSEPLRVQRCAFRVQSEPLRVQRCAFRVQSEPLRVQRCAFRVQSEPLRVQRCASASKASRFESKQSLRNDHSRQLITVINVSIALKKHQGSLPDVHYYLTILRKRSSIHSCNPSSNKRGSNIITTCITMDV